MGTAAHDTREATAEPTAAPAPASARAASRRRRPQPAVVARLQRTAGNSAVTALIQRSREPSRAGPRPFTAPLPRPSGPQGDFPTLRGDRLPG